MKYKCVNCKKPNMQLRCTNCGTLHNSKFEEQLFHMTLTHVTENELMVEKDVTEKELVMITGINLREDKLERFIKDGIFKYGFLEYKWEPIIT